MYVGNLRHSYERLLDILLEFKEFAIEKKIYKLKEEYQIFVKKEIKKLPLAFFQTKKNIIDPDFQNLAPMFFQSPKNANSKFLNKFIYFY